MRHRGHTVEVTIGPAVEGHDISAEVRTSPERGARVEALLTQSEVLKAIRVGSVGTAPALDVHELLMVAREQAARDTRGAMEKERRAERDTEVAALKDDLEAAEQTVKRLRANATFWREMLETVQAEATKNIR